MKLTGKEKALVFLSTLGDEVSAKVLRCLPDKLAAKISAELAAFPGPTPEAIALVFKELNKFALATVDRPKLTGVVESEASTEPIDSLSHLGRKTPQQLFSLLHEEEPQVLAYVLSYLSLSMREKFYQLLSPGKRSEVKKVQVEKGPWSDKVFELINEKILTSEIKAA